MFGRKSLKIGADFSLPSMVRNLLESEGKWETAVSFCGTLMSQKEAAERVRRSHKGLLGGMVFRVGGPDPSSAPPIVMSREGQGVRVMAFALP